MTRQYHRPIKRVRERFTPSPQLRESLDGFYEVVDPNLALYLSTEKVVDLTRQYATHYEQEMKVAQERAALLASRALTLGESVRIVNTGHSVNFLFDIDNHERGAVARMTGVLENISGFEKRSEDTDVLCLELAKESLATALKCNGAKNELINALKSPTRERHMKVFGPKIVAEDAAHLLSGRYYSPYD